ncbi:BtrH N-terminal domain-containing protein [Streptomyces sp. NBC_01294]|uniref:BtrH N-terminal domain-containing protein n=1 Tax=Streptomyces sp. NBC_01294 TaxID=2903815 RepID=UPI002DD94497|nr:BtrH N-terminal domain-containing protein [Streptomyces sp. NBC_01294]WRZ55491.1 BtrH N-terminal domain-containing protein [Streptomyces sp. NBC_01294]WRZ61207.1 BtrH N-terminal domain-containing protein [Streptomyces sp. NBC_01294]
MTEHSPRPTPAGLLYADFGTGRHRESSLVRHALGSTHDEALVAGLAGGIGFMYFVFEYAGHPPLLTIVAQAHPDPWARSALDRLRVPYEVAHSSKPRWDRVHAALDAGRPVFCTVDRSGLPWHEDTPEMAGADPYTVVLAGYDGDVLYVEDGAPAPYRIDAQEFGAAWSGHRKGRHQMIVPTGPATGAPDVEGALAATAARLTGPVLGNKFDVNFGFSGMEKLAAQLRDTRTKTGWERRFGAPEAFLAGTRRLYACLEEEWTAPGATRPLYADFLDLVGRPEAAALFRASAGHWSRLAELARAAGPDVDTAGRRALFDECAGLVDRSLDLERRAVTLL